MARLSVRIPHPLLKAWDLHLIDMPSLSPDHEDWWMVKNILSPKINPHVAIFYLCHSRGLSDHDELSLEDCRRTPTVLLVNIRKEELSPTRSVIELERWDSHQAVIPVILPMNIKAVATPNSAERQALLCTLACLRRRQITSMNESILRQLEQRKTWLAESGWRAFQEAMTIKNGGASMLKRLEALRCLVALENWFSVFKGEHAPRAFVLENRYFELEERCRRIERLNDVALKKDLECKASILADIYNVETIKAPRPKATKPDDTGEEEKTAFAKDLVEARNGLQKILSNLLEEKKNLGFSVSQVRILETIGASVKDGRSEVALLGMFSSGKSSVINALLDVPTDDRNAKLLPTAVKPETATVNRIVYADKPQLVKADWQDEVELTFLSLTPSLKNAFKVHHQEIGAFETWLRSGQVNLADCELHTLKPDTVGGFLSKPITLGPTTDRKLLDNLLSLIDIGRKGRRVDFLYFGEPGLSPSIPQRTGDIAEKVRITKEVPERVVIRRFAKKPTDLHPGMQLPQLFDIIKKPEIALRLDIVTVGFNHPLLKHIAFIDTPGTDSPIPHHRQMARERIQFRLSPVLYCFLSQQAAGREDTENLTILKHFNLDRGERDRKLFFTITRKALFEEKVRQDEIRNHVIRQLEFIGIKNPKVFFVEAVKYKDPEFEEMRQNLSRYLLSQLLPDYLAHVDHALSVVAEVKDDAKRQLEAEAMDAKQRENRRNTLSGMIEAVKAVKKEASGSYWGIEWVKKRLGCQLETNNKSMDDLIDGLTSRDAFDGFGKEAEVLLEDFNDTIEKMLNASIDSLINKLDSQLLSLIPNKKESPIENLDRLLKAPAFELNRRDAYFSGGTLLEKADRLVWPGWAKRIFTLGIATDKAVENNRAEIGRAWSASYKRGHEEINNDIRKMIEHVDNHLAVVIESLQKADKSLRGGLTAGQKNELGERFKRAEMWCKKLDSLKRVAPKLVVGN